jgi:hypothetical protein
LSESLVNYCLGFSLNSQTQRTHAIKGLFLCGAEQLRKARGDAALQAP